MSLQFILGGSGSGKSHFIYKQILERAKTDPRHFLVLVPDQFTMQTQKDLCISPDNDREGIMNIEVLSFSRLGWRIMEELGEDRALMLDDTGKNLILSRVAEEKKDELTVIGAHLKKIGYIHEVKSMLSEFYQYDIGEKELEDLIDYSQNKGSLAYKLKDLQILRQAFSDYIKGKYITTEEQLDRLCELLPKSEVAKNSVVVLDGFTGFTPIQNKLLRQLLLVADEVVVTLVADGEGDVCGGQDQAEEKLFYLSRHTYEILSKLAAQEQIEKKKDIVLTAKEEKGSGEYAARFCENAELGFLEKHLFRADRRQYGEATANIVLTECFNPRKELQAMLLEIKRLVRKEGYAYRDIAVVTGDLSRFEHLLQTEFDDYGVPLYMDKTRGILFHPMSEFVLSLLDLFVQDFTKESVMRFLRTMLAGLTREETDRLELYVERYGIRGKKAYEKLFTKGADRMETGELEAVNTSRQKFADLTEALRVLPLQKSVPAEKLIEAVYEICVRAGLQDKMEQYREQFEEQGDLAAAREYAQVYQAVVDLLDQMHDLLAGEALELDVFAQILKAGLSEITIGTIPQNMDQVVVGDIERTRLKQVKTLFFLGVNDGAVPKDSKGGGLLSDMEREFLRGAGHELAPTPREQIFQQRLYLYLNMTKPSERLYLSYSRVDNAGKTVRKSYLVGVLQKLFPKLSVVQAQELPLADRIATKEDGLNDLAELMGEYAGGELDSDEKRDVFKALIKAYLREGEEERIRQFLEAAFLAYRPQSLSAELAGALYGDIIESSVGRLERFSACAYAHFLQYGLKLNEETEYDVSRADMGTVYHEVMKRFAEFLKANGYHWVDFPIEEADAFVEHTMEVLAKEYENALFYSSEESLYAVTDMTQILKRTIRTLRYQMAKGLFEPRYFEMPFYVGDQIRAKGRIDRVDTYEKDGEIYVKVVDYKSGKNEFDPVEFYFGLKMQLAVYMKAAVETEQKKHKDKKVVPAALVYYQFQNPVVESEEGDLFGVDGSLMTGAVEKKLLEKMRLTGLVSEEEQVILALDQGFETESDVIPLKRKKDGSFTANSITAPKEQLALLLDYVDRKMAEVETKVYQGEIAVNPYCKKEKSACTYCSYSGICHFDPRIEGYRMRDLEGIGEDEAWTLIAEAVGKEE